eukprot:7848368-Prorocentrum_lima.AAC.1
MTSSLVGSEMCIRDSSLPDLHAMRFGPWKAVTPSWLLPPPGANDVLKPVSYTHLTLPTICSV